MRPFWTESRKRLVCRADYGRGGVGAAVVVGAFPGLVGGPIGPPGPIRPGPGHSPTGPIGADGPPRCSMWGPSWPRKWSYPGPECLPIKNPEKNTTATMNTAPATMPTHANAWNSRLGRLRSGTSRWTGGAGGGSVVSVGVVSGSAVSLMPSIMPTLVRRVPSIAAVYFL